MVSRLSAQAGAAAREAASGLRTTSSARSVGSDADDQVCAPRCSLRQLNAESESSTLYWEGLAQSHHSWPAAWAPSPATRFVCLPIGRGRCMCTHLRAHRGS
jgi:hypothetical protein